MTKEMIQRWLPVDDMDIKRVDRKGREVTAYAAVFASPAEIRDTHGHYWEEINGVAFNRTLTHGIQRVQVFYNHGYDLTGKPNMLGAVPIASPREVRPDGKGLLTRSYYNDSDLADAVLAGWEGGQIKGQSFTGRVYNSRKRGQRGQLDHIERMELGLKEYGPTWAPAYDDAGLVAIRNQDEFLELVRSMISDMVGTPIASSTSSSLTSNPEPETPEGSASDGHPDRAIHARRNAQRARRLILGVTRGDRPQV